MSSDQTRVGMIETVAPGPRAERFLRGTPTDDEILALWLTSHNTFDIANILFVKERDIANRLAGILQRQRQEKLSDQ